MVQELNNRPVEAIVPSQADVMQHKPLIVELEDNINSSRTQEMIKSNHDQVEKQSEGSNTHILQMKFMKILAALPNWNLLIVMYQA